MDNNKKDKLLEELTKSKGIVTTACNNSGVSRSSFYVWVAEDADFKKAVDDITEQAIDYVEGKLYNLIENEDTAATLFYLKTKGRKRGYQERTEVTGAEGKDLIPSVDFSKMTDEQIREYLRSRTRTD